MNFGFGVGDVIKIIELADTIRARFINAPEQFKAVSDEYVTILTPRSLYTYVCFRRVCEVFVSRVFPDNLC